MSKVMPRDRLEGLLRRAEKEPWTMAELVRLMILAHKEARTVGQSDRLAVGMALWRLLRRYGDELEPVDRRALFDLSEALALLEDGVVAPMFRPTEFSGGRPTSRHGRIVMFGLVAGCIALESLGLSRKQARTELTKLCRTLKLQASGQRAITAGTLYSWWKKHRGDEHVEMMARILSSERPTSGDITRKLTRLLVYPPSRPEVSSRFVLELGDAAAALESDYQRSCARKLDPSPKFQ